MAELSLETNAAAAASALAGGVEPVVAGTPEARVRGRRRLGVAFWSALVWLVVIIGSAVLAKWLPKIGDPEKISAALKQGPSGEHWLGTDGLGRDILTRVVYGARSSLFIGVVAIAFGMAVGGTLGLIGGFYGRRTDRVISAVTDVLLAFPALVLALAVVSFLGQSVSKITIALGILSVPALARIARASTLTFAQREFVTAARSLGASNRRIVVREILPNVVPPMASFALVAVAVVIVAEGSLSFLGLGVPPPTPTWGGMIAEGRAALETDAYIALMPAGVMFLTVLALNYVGDGLQTRLNVKGS